MSVRGQLYGKINEKLQALYSAGTISHFDYNFHQFEKQGEQFPVSYPSVTYSLGNITWSGNTGATQFGITELFFEVVFDLGDDIDLLITTPESNTGRTFIQEVYETVDTIDTAIQSITGNTFSPILRLSEENKINSEEMQWLWKMRYLTNLSNDSNYVFGRTIENETLDLARVIDITASKVSKLGDTMYGNLFVPIITGGTIYSGSTELSSLWSNSNNLWSASTGAYSIIPFGRNNTASGYLSIIAGGNNNTASGDKSFIGNGLANTATDQYASIMTGYNNQATGYASLIGGGRQNRAGTTYSLIGNGVNNSISAGLYSTILNGRYCGVNDSYSTVIGGYYNIVYGRHSFISNGQNNYLFGDNSAIIGGSYILGLASNTVYVPSLIANDLQGGGPMKSIATDTFGRLILYTSATISMHSECVAFNPADATTYYVGSLYTLTASTTSKARRVYVPTNCKLKAVSYWITCTTGTSETATLNFRLNDASNTQISNTIQLNSVNVTGTVTGLGTEVTAGSYFEWQIEAPTWTTNPTGVIITVDAYFE